MIWYLKNHNTCESYYVRERHSNVDYFYLPQNYFKLQWQTIRENTNFICLFPQDLTNLILIFDVHMGCYMTNEEFRQLCKASWENSTGLQSLILAVKNTMVNKEVVLTSATYQIKLKIKTIIIFSLQNKWRIFLIKL